MNESQRELLAEGERLILAAFAAARDKGVPDWRRMTTAVLKNRLLALTNREFDERHWSATSFRHFLAQYPDVVAIDATRRPAVVELLSDQEREAASTAAHEPAWAITARHRIRSDLWRAVLDYSSGRRYVWDENEAAAVAVGASDEDPRLTLPTVDEATYGSWRDEFARSQSPLVSAPQREAIERWRIEGLPTTQLPPAIRGLWNAEVKRHVIETLEAWFEAHELGAPDDLVRTEQPPPRPSMTSTEGLRDLILACVAVMTREELEAIGLPPAAVLRMRRKREPEAQ